MYSLFKTADNLNPSNPENGSSVSSQLAINSNSTIIEPSVFACIRKYFPNLKFVMVNDIFKELSNINKMFRPKL